MKDGFRSRKVLKISKERDLSRETLFFVDIFATGLSTGYVVTTGLSTGYVVTTGLSTGYVVTTGLSTGYVVTTGLSIYFATGFVFSIMSS